MDFRCFIPRSAQHSLKLLISNAFPEPGCLPKVIFILVSRKNTVSKLSPSIECKNFLRWTLAADGGAERPGDEEGRADGLHVQARAAGGRGGAPAVRPPRLRQLSQDVQSPVSGLQSRLPPGAARNLPRHLEGTRARPDGLLYRLIRSNVSISNE